VFEKGALRRIFGAKGEEVNKRIENIRPFIMKAPLFTKYS
jgi:hypothetical protein